MSERSQTIRFQRTTANKSFSKKSRTTKLSNRQIKRKRRKNKYHKTLKRRRFNQGTKDICSSLELFDMKEMDSAPSSSHQTLPSEVIEWQRQDQLSYWKSRAISLEYENQMLRQHLRNVYAKTVEVQFQGYPLNETVSETNEITSTADKRKSEKCEEEEVVVLPNIPNVKQRTEEMSELYGEKAQILIGMETAMQLNYEKHSENSNPVLWPNYPLKFVFND
nr:gem-associated protein 8-like [Leptinotarsa decemlineata]